MREIKKILRNHLPQGITVHADGFGHVVLRGQNGEFIASACRLANGNLGGVRSFFGPIDLARGVGGLKAAAEAYCTPCEDSVQFQWLDAPRTR